MPWCRLHILIDNLKTKCHSQRKTSKRGEVPGGWCYLSSSVASTLVLQWSPTASCALPQPSQSRPGPCDSWMSDCMSDPHWCCGHVHLHLPCVKWQTLPPVKALCIILCKFEATISMFKSSQISPKNHILSFTTISLNIFCGGGQDRWQWPWEMRGGG